MDKAMAMLPSTIEEATKGTPVILVSKAVGEKKVEAFLAFELNMLASMVNVDERLNLQPHQIPIIAQELMRTFPTENLADFHICFRRGAMGFYDEKLLRVDGAIITQWMRKYLEEKYQVIEAQLMKEKDDPYRTMVSKPVEKTHAGRDILSALEVVLQGKDPGVDLSKHLSAEELDEVKQAQRDGVHHTDSDNSKLNEYERFKLNNPYRYFTVRGIRIMARTEEMAIKRIEEMLKSGELEEDI